MKKFFMLLTMLIFAVFLFSGCVEKTDVSLKEEKKESVSKDAALPFSEPLEFMFSSGAGAWRTELWLKNDGSFTGSFHDSNMGESGEDYPYGTCYVCDFSGSFDDIEKIDETSYKMTLSHIVTEREEGEEWIEDGVLYVVSTPYGIEGGTEFVLYTPLTEIKNLPEEFLWWWPLRFSDEIPETLEHYGIHNINTDDGFFTYQ